MCATIEKYNAIVRLQEIYSSVFTNCDTPWWGHKKKKSFKQLTMTDTQQLAALIKACDFAAKKHRNQKRKDGLGKKIF